MNTEEFIRRAKIIHGDKYDYSKTKYVNAQTKVCIICPIHGEFWQRYSDHLYGRGCKKCMAEKLRNDNSLSQEEFIRKAREVHGDKYDYSKVIYNGNKKKICIICPIHGEFWQIAGNHLRGYGCQKCVRSIYDTESFTYKANITHHNKYDYSKVKYEEYDKPVCIICHKKDENGIEHGEFWQTPHGHTQGNGCPKCAIEGIQLQYRMTTQEFIKKAEEVHGDKYDYSKVEYVNCNTPICIICPIHGEFWQKPHNHLTGSGCILCNESRCETKVRKILLSNDIHFEYQKRFNWLGKQSLDFYLPDYNIAIECQGVQHFKPVSHFGGILAFHKQYKKDKIKWSLCEEHNIKILYYTINKEILNSSVIRNENDLLKEIWKRK